MPDYKKDPALKSRGMSEEAQYISDRRAALLLHRPTGARLLLFMVFLSFIALLVWSWYAVIDETVKGMGKVIPSQRVQKIQHLEGGVIKEIEVAEGQTVDKGQLLMVISDVQFQSSLQESEAEFYGLMAKMERLRAESQGTALKFSDELEEKYPSFVEGERTQFKANQDKVEDNVQVFKSRTDQQQRERTRLGQELSSAKKRKEVSEDKLARMKRLFERGAVSQVDVIQAGEEVDEWELKIQTTGSEIRKIDGLLQEIRKSIDKIYSDFKSEAGEQFNLTRVKLKSLEANLSGLTDKETRTNVTSPIKGVVNKIHITTIGGVVQPGMVLLEIIPIDDKLLIEAKVAPKDIGFLRIGMVSKVKLTAYSFATYGGLEGHLKHISADTTTDEKGRTFFIVRVETDRTSLGTKEHPLPIIPGMQAEVDIIVDRKTIINYILKPMLKARERFVTPGT